VEITPKGLSQVQVHPKIGWSFAQALGAFLRADPQVRGGLLERAPAATIQAAALEKGMLTRTQDDVLEVLQRLTGLREVRAASV
jgi:type II secretory ATPase GspE/PulE/Tfp pilus assembly ATPase PilB-like protein